MAPRIPRLALKIVICVLSAGGLAWSGYHLGALEIIRALARPSLQSGQRVQGPAEDHTVRPFVMERLYISYADPKGKLIRKEILGRWSDGSVFTATQKIIAAYLNYT